jgi:hypothetical protein
VGYQTLTASGQFYSSGATFISVGDVNGQWLLGDITATGMDPFNDNIQFLSTATASAVLTATYIDEATSIAFMGDTSMVGWWDLSFATSLDNEVLNAGTAFLCNFSSTGVTLTYSGEVMDGDTTLDLSGVQYPFVANFTPIDLTLGDITATGMDPFNDNIQFLSVTTASAEVTATYIDEATSIAFMGDTSMVGWWDLSFATSLNAQPFPAGSAFLCNFTSTGVMITFPDPVL